MRADEVQTLLEAAYRAMAEEQLEPLMELYTPDAIIQSAGELPIVGKDAIKGFWAATFAQFRVSLAPLVEECTEVAADTVVVRGRAIGVFAPKLGGEAVPVDSWFLQVYRRGSDGRLHYWRGANGARSAQA